MLDFTKELGSVASRQDPFWTKFYEAVARHGTMLAQWEKAVVDTVNLDAAYPSPTAEQKVIIARPLVRVIDLYHHNVPLIITLYDEFKGTLDGTTDALRTFLTSLNALRAKAASTNGLLFIGQGRSDIHWSDHPRSVYVSSQTWDLLAMGIAEGVREPTTTKQLAYRSMGHVPVDRGISAYFGGRIQVAVGMDSSSEGYIWADDERNGYHEPVVSQTMDGYQVLCWLAEYVRGQHPDYTAIDPQTLTLSGAANPVLPMARDWYHILRFMRETVNPYANLSFSYVTDEEYQFLESLPDVL